jgi:sulfate transport system ATP-binding protein
MPVTVGDGDVWLDGQRLSLSPNGTPPGPAQLFVRPHDLDVAEPGPGALEGVVTMVRRNGGGRRVEICVGKDRHRVEIEVPAELSPEMGSRLAVRPRRWRLFAESVPKLAEGGSGQPGGAN